LCTTADAPSVTDFDKYDYQGRVHDLEARATAMQAKREALVQRADQESVLIEAQSEELANAIAVADADEGIPGGTLLKLFAIFDFVFVINISCSFFLLA
jgi:hypothetical protein